MTPKEKAKELVDKIQEGLWRDRAVRIYQEDAVYNALIAVDEILEASLYQFDEMDKYVIYWQEVKQEIELL
jgi:hypothetical protein